MRSRKATEGRGQNRIMDRNHLKNILVIDNSENSCDCMRALFHEEGFSCIRVKDGNIKDEILENHAPDLVIVDMTLPRVYAPEVLNSLRNSNLISCVPILMISRHGTARDKLMGYAFGANSFITKPIENKVLLDEINRLIKRGQTVCC